MAAPITPAMSISDGKPILIWVPLTAAGGTMAMVVTLPTYAPKIDLRIGHPVISGVFITDETDVTGSEVFTPANEMARGTAPDGIGEWEIEDESIINIYQTANQDGYVGFCYIPFGVQLA